MQTGDHASIDHKTVLSNLIIIKWRGGSSELRISSSGELAVGHGDVPLHLLDEVDAKLGQLSLVIRQRPRRAVGALGLHGDLDHAAAHAGGLHLVLDHLRLELRRRRHLATLHQPPRRR